MGRKISKEGGPPITVIEGRHEQAGERQVAGQEAGQSLALSPA